MSDLLYSLRRLRQSPGFTTVAVLLIALGIGANTAIFTIVNAILFQPQPYERPAELVQIYTTDEHGENPATSSYPDYRDLVNRSDLFRGVASSETSILSTPAAERTEVVLGEYVSANYFEVLGLRASRGRVLSAALDGGKGSAPVAVVGFNTWRQRFHADPTIIGRTVRLNGREVTVVGVGPENFGSRIVGITADFWLPVASVGPLLDPNKAEQLERRSSRSAWIQARLNPGVTPSQAQAALDVVAAQWAQAFPESNDGRRLSVVPTSDVRILPVIDRALAPVGVMLLIVVGLVLAVACSNLANLLLARAAAREREIAIRLALGAGRGRLVRQLLMESTALAILGGAGGLLLAYWLSNALLAFKPDLPIPVAIDLRMDWRVAVYAGALAVLTGVLFGLAPALAASRPALIPALKNEQWGVRTTGRRFGLRNLLVVGQVAMSALLLVGAGLFLRSLVNMQGVSPGFVTDRAAVAMLGVNFAPPGRERGAEYFRQLLERVRSLPGVQAVAVADRLPLGIAIRTRGVRIDGVVPPQGREDFEIDIAAASPDYFAAMNVPLLYGRAFTDRDDETSRPVAVVSEAMARRFFGGATAMGKVVRFGLDGPPVEIVGVARDTKVRTLGEDPRPYLYVPFAQERTVLVSLVVRTAGDPAALADLLRRELIAFDPDVPVMESKTMTEHLGLPLLAPRLGAGLLAAFGALAMALACLGLYGVVAHTVARRTRELGIRMALGARRGQVVTLVVREGMVMVGIGLGIGLGLATVAAIPLSGLLYGLRVIELPTFGAVAVGLVGAALLASVFPARRAARIEPTAALRYD